MEKEDKVSAQQTDIFTLKTTIKNIMFEKDGYIIAKTTSGDTVRGNVHHKATELEKTDVELSGEWKDHEKYGKSFHFTNYTVMGNYDLFFLTRMVKGISKKVAVDLLSKTKNLGYIIENEPSTLLTIKGIGQKKLELIIRTFKEEKPFHNLASILLPYGVTPAKIRQIFDYYKDKNSSAILEIKRNPYVLTKMSGIGFKMADKIALKLGTEVDSEFRLQSGIEYAIKEYSSQGGHTYCELEDLFTLSSEVLSVENVIVEADMDSVDGIHESEKKILNYTLSQEAFLVEVEALMVAERMTTVGNDSQKVTIPYLAKAEECIKSVVAEYAFKPRGDLVDDIEAFIDRAERENGFKFGRQQRKAIRLANLDFPITYLYGLAGSGKTTTSKNILDLYAIGTDKDMIRGCSLSGVASARSQNVTGYQANTIHSLLKFKGKDGFEYNENNKLPYRLILLEESSMTDSYLFASLLRAINFDVTSLVMVGDYSQLPSIGSGSVFQDLIQKQYCRGTELDEVFRQSAEQVINIFATNYVRKGLVPEGYKNNTYEDFFFYPVEIPNQWAIKKNSTDAEWKDIREKNNLRIVETIETIARNHVGIMNLYEQKNIKEYISAFQVISPQKKGVVGVHELNIRMQKILNPYKYSNILEFYGKVFKPRDKVIHLHNINRKVCDKEAYRANRGNLSGLVNSDLATERKVFNGSMGVILDILVDDDNDVISVYYPNDDYIAFYKQNDFEVGMIDLSWAISIHKSQGSEFSNLVVIFSASHFSMLSNSLTYTAITRAKKRLYVVGESFAFEKGCKQISRNKRKTILSL